jgi:hypothetical protein
MRFATKFDRRMIVMLIIGAAVSLGLPTRSLLVRHQPPLPIALLPWAIWAVVLVAMLPQYYDVRDDGLFIRQGLRKVLIPYASLAEMQPFYDTRSAGVFSCDRMRVVTSQLREYVIAPADADAFLDAVARRAPQLQRKGMGLSLPLSVPDLS